MAKTDPRVAMTGTGWQCQIGNKSADYPGWLPQLAALYPRRLWWWRNEPEVRNGIKIPSGLPDYGCTLDGHPILIECKHTSNKASVQLGRLIKNPDRDTPEEGVSWIQAANMDSATLAGWTCFVAVRLEVNAATLRKASQVRLDGTGGDMPPVLCRLIPWSAWRARMAAAEDARRRGQEPQASIPAADLAVMGWPCRNAGELLAAIRGS